MKDRPDLPLPVPVEMLLPHRKPMCLVDRLVEFRDASGVVEALVGQESPLVAEDGCLDRIAFIELIAQSYATVRGYSDLLRGEEVRKGFLVAAKMVEVKKAAAAGDVLRISVTTTGEFGDFTLADGVVRKEGEILASGNITVWVP
jgi:predicted hotdog family 3-hydroxylacyl-ACP dehydratase